MARSNDERDEATGIEHDAEARARDDEAPVSSSADAVPPTKRAATRSRTPKPPASRRSKTPKPPSAGPVSRRAKGKTPAPPPVRVEAERLEILPPGAATLVDVKPVVETIDEELFFAASPAPSGSTAPMALEGRRSEPPPNAKALVSDVDARRRRLERYVKLAVVCSSALCLAAITRVGVSRLRPETPTAYAASAIAPATAPAIVAETSPAIDPAPATAAEPATAIPTLPPAPAEPPAPTKSATEERDDARKLLERGKAKDAYEAAQRSVAIDPTDADAWLLVGAAAQELGKGKEAHEAFVTCTKQAKKGEVGECRALLTWNGPR